MRVHGVCLHEIIFAYTFGGAWCWIPLPLTRYCAISDENLVIIHKLPLLFSDRYRAADCKFTCLRLGKISHFNNRSLWCLVLVMDDGWPTCSVCSVTARNERRRLLGFGWKFSI